MSDGTQEPHSNNGNTKGAKPPGASSPMPKTSNPFRNAWYTLEELFPGMVPNLKSKWFLFSVGLLVVVVGSRPFLDSKIEEWRSAKNERDALKAEEEEQAKLEEIRRMNPYLAKLSAIDNNQGVQEGKKE